MCMIWIGMTSPEILTTGIIVDVVLVDNTDANYSYQSAQSFAFFHKSHASWSLGLFSRKLNHFLEYSNILMMCSLDNLLVVENLGCDNHGLGNNEWEKHPFVCSHHAHEQYGSRLVPENRLHE